jgi:hypothetical protein
MISNLLKRYQNSKTVAKINQPQNWGEKIEKHFKKTTPKPTDTQNL